MDYLQHSLYFISGLAIFFVGQRLLSQGLQVLGGRIVKNIVHNEQEKLAFKNFWDGAKLALIGFSQTMATMVVTGLVNANLLKSYRVLPMYMGTLLGGSAILFVISLGGHDRGLNAMAIGLLIGLFFRSNHFRNIGKFLIGLGLLYIGISIMGEAVKLLVLIPGFADFMLSLKNLSFLASLIVATFVGISISLVLTSSTMVYSIVVVCANLGIIQTEFLFGLSLGASSSSFLMAFFMSKADARVFALRSVFVPLISTLISIFVGIILLTVFHDFMLVPLDPIQLVVSGTLVFSLLTFFHTYLFRSLLVSFSRGFIPEEEISETARLKYLGQGRFISPTMAFVLVEMEVTKLMDVVNRMFNKCGEYLETSHKGARTLAKIKDYERIIDNIQNEISVFTEKVISSGAGEEDSKLSLYYLKLAVSLEQMADALDKMATMSTKFYEHWELTELEKSKLLVFFNQIRRVYSHSYKIFNGTAPKDASVDDVIEEALDLKKTLLLERETYANTHNDSDPRRHLYYSDMLVSLAKVRGHTRDIYSLIHK